MLNVVAPVATSVPVLKIAVPVENVLMPDVVHVPPRFSKTLGPPNKASVPMIDPELVTWVKPSLAEVWITRLDGELVREPIKPVLAIVIGPIAATLIVGLVAVPAPRTRGRTWTFPSFNKPKSRLKS
jgi:hypothetical protein